MSPTSSPVKALAQRVRPIAERVRPTAVSAYGRLRPTLRKAFAHSPEGVQQALRSGRRRAVGLAQRSGPVPSLAELHAYWGLEEPIGYSRNREATARAHSETLLRLLPSGVNHLEKGDRVLELGSGVGRNLAALVDAGYTAVEGVELSRPAVDRMRRDFPQLTDVTVHVGALEDVLPTLDSDAYRLVYSMDTLGWVHPEAIDGVLAEMSRIGAHHLLIEPETVRAAGRRHFAHDLGGGLERHGMSAFGQQVDLSTVLPTTDDLASTTACHYKRMDSLASLRKFWTQPEPQGNVPRTYLNPVWRSKALLELVSDLPADARILEVGCNVGRNLAYLHDHGYPDVTGIEINPHAVELLRESFPQLAERPVHVGPAGDILPGLPDDSFDLVFTMAVIEHIHPDESHIFDEMVRVSRDVLSIEPRSRLSHRQFPHDVVEIFTSRGMELVSERPMTDFDYGADHTVATAFTAYRFAPAD